jgi:hypothetical protein
MASCLHNKCKEWAECCLWYDDGTRNNSALSYNTCWFMWKTERLHYFTTLSKQGSDTISETSCFNAELLRVPSSYHRQHSAHSLHLLCKQLAIFWLIVIIFSRMFSYVKICISYQNIDFIIFSWPLSVYIFLTMNCKNTCTWFVV